MTKCTLHPQRLYNVFIKKCSDPACIAKWGKDYPSFHSAIKELWPNIFKTPYTIPGKLR